MCGNTKQLADGHHARAADAGDENPVLATERWQRRRRYRCSIQAGSLRAPGSTQFATLYGHKAWAEAVQAREILVAAGLIDRALAPELRIERFDRQAVGFLRTIAAAFTHPVVDYDAPGRIRIRIALAPAALFGCASLVVNEDRDATDLAQPGLHPLKCVAMQNIDASRQVGDPFIFAGIVGHHHHRADTLRRNLLRDHRHRQRAVHRLAAGHRDGVVEQNLVGHIDLGRDSSPYCKQTGVVVSAITQIRKNM